MRRVVTLGIVLTLAGCGVEQNGADPGTSTGIGTGSEETAINQPELINSGARLRARLGRTADGAQAFLGWHDRTLGAPCTIGPTTDGKLRCVPGAFGTLYYADPTCQTPIVMISGCVAGAPRPEVVQAYDTDKPVACSGAGTVAMRAFRQLRDHSGQVFVKSGASCTEITASFAALPNYRKLKGAEMPPADMVEVTEAVE